MNVRPNALWDDLCNSLVHTIFSTGLQRMYRNVLFDTYSARRQPADPNALKWILIYLQ